MSVIFVASKIHVFISHMVTQHTALRPTLSITNETFFKEGGGGGGRAHPFQKGVTASSDQYNR